MQDSLRGGIGGDVVLGVRGELSALQIVFDGWTVEAAEYLRCLADGVVCVEVARSDLLPDSHHWRRDVVAWISGLKGR